MLHERVGTGVVDALVAVVLPSHEVGRAPSGPSHLEDLGVALGLALMVAVDHQVIPDAGLQAVGLRM
jgi:hypothetical protein